MEYLDIYGVGSNDKLHIISIELSYGEKLERGMRIILSQFDGRNIEREIIVIDLFNGKKWKYNVEGIQGPCFCHVTVENIESYNIVTTRNVESREFSKRMSKIISITPYIELKQGHESIFDNIAERQNIPEKVIIYLKNGKGFAAASGVYENPFDKSRLLGPEILTDGIYKWDRDTWKYVSENNLKLPDNFVDYVISLNCIKYAFELIKCFPEKKEKLYRHLEDYKMFLAHVFFAEEINEPLIELLTNNKDSDDIFKYCSVIEYMISSDDKDILNVVDVTILERLSDEDNVWIEFGKHMSKSSIDYINKSISENCMTMGVKPLINN